MIAGQIIVRDLDFGTIPPELDLLALEEMSVDGGFRGRFMLSYSGDAFMSLAANVQVSFRRHGPKRVLVLKHTAHLGQPLDTLQACNRITPRDIWLPCQCKHAGAADDLATPPAMRHRRRLLPLDRPYSGFQRRSAGKPECLFNFRLYQCHQPVSPDGAYISRTHAYQKDYVTKVSLADLAAHTVFRKLSRSFESGSDGICHRSYIGSAKAGSPTVWATAVLHLHPL